MAVDSSRDRGRCLTAQADFSDELPHLLFAGIPSSRCLQSLQDALALRALTLALIVIATGRGLAVY